MATASMPHNGCHIQLQSEISIDRIVLDSPDESLVYASLIGGESKATKIIPAGQEDNVSLFRKTQYRTTWENQNNQKRGLFARCFKSQNQNLLTRRQAAILKQRELLNDYAYETEKDDWVTKLSKWLNQKIKVFEPDSHFSLIWQSLNALFVIYFFFEIPFLLCFEKLINERIEQGKADKEHPAKYAIYEEFVKIQFVILILAIVLFILDIFVQFNTAFFKQGQLVFRRRMIAEQYLKTYFCLDLIPTTCLIQQILIINKEHEIQGMYQILFGLKLYEILRTFNTIEEYLQLQKKVLSYFRLVEVMLSIVWLCHLFGCIFHAIGYKYSGDDNRTRSWINQIDLFRAKDDSYDDQSYKEATVVEIYSYSFYWAVTTMASVGYGDVTPKNIDEVWVATISMFISCIVFAFSINAIWEVINQSKESKTKFQKYVNAIERFMRDHKVNRKLKTKIEAYLYHLWETEKARDQESEQLMIQKLAPALREELLFNTFGRMLQTKNFMNLFGQDLLKGLASDIEQVSFSQEEVIFQIDDEVTDFPIYYLIHGQVDIYLQRDNQKPFSIQVIKPETSFGIIGFIGGVARTANAKCLTYTRLYMLSREKLLRRLDEFEEEKERFHEIRHQIIFGQEYQQLNMRCYICESRNHIANNCNNTFYSPQKQKLIFDYSSLKNERISQFQRRKGQAYKALPHLKDLQAYAHVIRRTIVNFTFENDDSSGEDNEEFSSDVDAYDQEMDELEEKADIKKLVDEEKERADLKKHHQFLEDGQFIMKVDQEDQQMGTSQEIEIDQYKSQLVMPRKSDDDSSKGKKKKPKRRANPINRDIRTSSMVSLKPIQEEKAFHKVGSPTIQKLDRKRKMTTDTIDPPSALRQIKKVEPVVNERKIQLLRRLKTMKSSTPSNALMQELFDDLKNYLHKDEVQASQGQPKSVSPELGKSKEDYYNEVESDFSVDKLENFEKFFPQSNPKYLIKRLNRYNKGKQGRPRTTLTKGI